MQQVYLFLCLSFCPWGRAKRGIWSKRVLIRKSGNFSFSVRWRNNTIIYFFLLDRIFLRNNCDCKAVEGPDIFEKLLWLWRCDFEGILQLFINFYLHRKVLKFLRIDSDCKDVNLYNTRKRYTVIESLDLMRNMSWLASCFSKIKKPNKQEIKVWLPVFTFWHDFTYLSFSNILS